MTSDREVTRDRSHGSPKGALTPGELRDRVQAGDIETVVVAFPDHYGRLSRTRT